MSPRTLKMAAPGYSSQLEARGIANAKTSAAMMLSSTAAWAVLRVEFQLGEKADVGWQEGRMEARDLGLEGEVGALEEDAV